MFGYNNPNIYFFYKKVDICKNNPLQLNRQTQLKRIKILMPKNNFIEAILKIQKFNYFKTNNNPEVSLWVIDYFYLLSHIFIQRNFNYF